MSRDDPRKDYLANADGWVGGRRVKKDQPLKLSPYQAKYENVRLAKPEGKSTAKAETAKS